jgi:hypothetical protein
MTKGSCGLLLCSLTVHDLCCPLPVTLSLQHLQLVGQEQQAAPEAMAKGGYQESSLGI